MRGVYEVQASLDGVHIDAQPGNGCLRPQIVALDGDEQMADALKLLVMCIDALADMRHVSPYFPQYFKHQCVIVGHKTPLSVGMIHGFRNTFYFLNEFEVQRSSALLPRGERGVATGEFDL
jgi:hypothetical protein